MRADGDEAAVGEHPMDEEDEEVEEEEEEVVEEDENGDEQDEDEDGGDLRDDEDGVTDHDDDDSDSDDEDDGDEEEVQRRAGASQRCLPSWSVLVPSGRAHTRGSNAMSLHPATTACWPTSAIARASASCYEQSIRLECP